MASTYAHWPNPARTMPTSGDAFAPLIIALVEFPKPLIAAVHGRRRRHRPDHAVYCDVVYVAENARLRAPFTSLGTAPEAASSWLLPKVIGTQRAGELILSARWLSGIEAADYGLATAAVAADEVHARARESAEQIAANVGPAVLAAKRLLRHGWAEEARAAVQRGGRRCARVDSRVGEFCSEIHDYLKHDHTKAAARQKPGGRFRRAQGIS